MSVTMHPFLGWQTLETNFIEVRKLMVTAGKPIRVPCKEEQAGEISSLESDTHHV